VREELQLESPLSLRERGGGEGRSAARISPLPPEERPGES
jgi:hypothetical protein